MNHNSEQAVDGRTSDSDRSALEARDLAHAAHQFGTPLLVIDERQLRSTMRRFRSAFARDGWRCDVVYAAKALGLKAIANIAHAEGLALDVCSEGELQAALQAGVPASRCLLHGCAKTDQELALAVRSGVGYIVLDHHAEIESVARMAAASGAPAPVLVRINVGVAAQTRSQVQTSALESKFGFPLTDGQALRAIRAVRERSALDFRGIHCHIGSQIVDLASYSEEIERLVDFASQLELEHGVPCGVINVGGGLGISSEDERGAPTPEAWAQVIYEALERTFAASPRTRPQLMVEPGRAIVARAGTTLYTIVVRKQLGTGRTALIVDGGMSDNPRPALYEATYPVRLLARPSSHSDVRYTVFGRHCESDLLFRDVPLDDPQPGDVLQVADTGAYTYSMASNYNRFPRPAVALADGRSFRLIARRESLHHLLDLDVFDEPRPGEARA